MKKQPFIVLMLVLVLLMTVTGAAFASEHEELAPCEGDSVEGTVIAVDDETGTITIMLGDESECTVETNTDYDHPITDLLAYYFSDANPDTLAEALDTLTVCATVDDEGNYVLSEFDEEGVCDGEELIVTSDGDDDDDSTFVAFDAEGGEIALTIEDEDAAGDLASAFIDLEADWDLNEDGTVADVGDDIEAYHEDGWGYGELVKLYSISAESYESCETADEPVGGDGEVIVEGEEPAEEDDVCGVTVEELMAMMEEDDLSMGDLFEIFGRPTMMGVGHVKQATSDGGGGGDGSKGVCHARSVGGNAYAGGKEC